MAGKDADNGVVEFQFYKPDNRTKWEAFQTAIYDKSSNQFFGRTPKSWGQLLFFYSIFYLILAALFAICMQVLFATLDDKEPKWKLGQSLIGVNPGLGFRPISENSAEGSLIWYNITDTTTTDKWVNLIDKFMEPYQANQTGPKFVPCDFGKEVKNDGVCITTSEQFNRCKPERMYGYNTTSPCIFLKLNRIIDWVPVYITEPLPDMPEKLKTYIQNLNDTNSEERRVWVTCNGVTDIDKENIKDINYFPKGFASYYYPYKNTKNYLSPIVAVEFVDVQPNVVIQIECRSWAKNINYRGGSLNRAGSVTFELQVDREFQPPSTIKSSDLKVEENKEGLKPTIIPDTSTSVKTTLATAATA